MVEINSQSRLDESSGDAGDHARALSCGLVRTEGAEAFHCCQSGWAKGYFPVTQSAQEVNRRHTLCDMRHKLCIACHQAARGRTLTYFLI